MFTVYFLRPEIRDFHENRQKRVIALIGMIICAIGFASFAAFYFWPQRAADSSPLDDAIQITSELSRYPTVLPQNKIFELQLNNNFMVEGGAFLGWILSAGSPLPIRDPSVSPSDGARLRISNYGKIVIINARITFTVEYRAIENMENGTRSGEIIKSATATTNPFSLAPGEIIDIYAMNYSRNAFAVVLIPPTAQGFAPGSDKLETFKLIPPFLSGIIVHPFAPKSPPSPAPPVSSLPSKPGKR